MGFGIGGVILSVGIGVAVYLTTRAKDSTKEPSPVVSNSKQDERETKPLAVKPTKQAPSIKPNVVESQANREVSWMIEVELEVEVFRSTKRVVEPVRGSSMTQKEFDRLLRFVPLFRGRYPLTQPQDVGDLPSVFSRLESDPALAIMPESSRVIKREMLSQITRKFPNDNGLEHYISTYARSYPELRRLLDVAVRVEMRERLPFALRKTLLAKFAAITGGKEEWSLLHPFDELNGNQMNAVIGLAEKAKVDGLKSLKVDERRILLVAGGVDFVEHILKQSR